jgi:rhodanese-related sulfurtransferase
MQSNGRVGLRAALLAGLVFAGAAGAATGTLAPEDIPGSTRVTAEELITLAGRLPGLVLIDARLASDRRHGYLEGSVNLPDEETSCPRLADLVPATDAPVLFYCNGPACLRSAKAVRVALGCGYTQVYWFRGGLQEWRDKRYPFLTEGP